MKKQPHDALVLGSRTLAVRRRLVALQGRQLFHEKKNEMMNQSSGLMKKKPHDALVSVSSIAGHSQCLVRFMCSSVEEMYELLREILRPMSEELVGLNAYSDRCCCDDSGSSSVGGDDGNSHLTYLSAGHPVRLLREHDIHNKLHT